MSLSDLAPNWALMRQPANWAFVLFVIALVVLLATVVRQGRKKESQ